MTLEITVDSRLDKRVQRNLILHEILENYFRSVDHEKIEELVDILSDALDELES